VMERRGQNISVLLMGLGVLAFVVAFAGLKMGSVWAWNALWALVLALAAIAALTLTEGRADLGIYYLLLALIAASAQLLARKGLRG
jgi:O-antigen ligase